MTTERETVALTPNGGLFGSPPRATKCQKAEHHGCCCCNCKNHIQDFHHCTTVVSRPLQKCVCSQPKGWICMPPEFDGAAYSGWTEHGICEMHEPATPKSKKQPNRAEGGKRRAIVLSAPRRKEIALMGAAARWKKP